MENTGEAVRVEIELKGPGQRHGYIVENTGEAVRFELKIEL